MEYSAHETIIYVLLVVVIISTEIILFYVHCLCINIVWLWVTRKDCVMVPYIAGYGATFLVHAMVKVWEIRPAIFANATLLAQCSMVFGQTYSNELYPALPFVAFQSTASKKSLSIPFLCRTSGNFTVKLARLPLILNRMPWAFSSFFFKFSLFWNLSFSVDMIWNVEHSELCLCS